MNLTKSIKKWLGKREQQRKALAYAQGYSYGRQAWSGAPCKGVPKNWDSKEADEFSRGVTDALLKGDQA